MNTITTSDINTAMSVYRHMLSRNLRIVLLLLLLASQSIAHSHELTADHTFGSQTCSSCHMGNGFGAAIDSDQTEIVFQSVSTSAPVHAAEFVVTSRACFYFGRAPPASLYLK